MTWLKLGAYYLNLDNVTSVEVNEHTPDDKLEVTVFYTTGLAEAGRANDTFSGTEAASLLRYLEQQVANNPDTTT